MKFQLIAFIAFLSFCSSEMEGQELPNDFYETEFDFTLDRPIGLRFMDNGSAFIFGKKGYVWVMDSLGNLQVEPVLDISEEVTDWGDHGLVSMALDPDYPEEPYIYLYYVVDRHHLLHYGTAEYDAEVDIYNQASIGRVSRFEIEESNGNFKGLKSSQKVIFGKTWSEGNPILMSSHGVGSIVFGGDGSLLLSAGDAGSYTQVDLGDADDTYQDQAIEDGIITSDENIGSFRSMLRNSLAGKIIRIDPETGLGLPNNPFYNADDPNAKISKVWCYGFRNPYKFIYVDGTSTHTEEGDFPGKFIIGDVGSSWYEEINVSDRPGQWFGWPKFEGIDGNWQFDAARVKNPEAVNPRFEDGCGEERYYFSDLLFAENESDSYIFNLPCDGITPMPEGYPRFVHRRPALSYSNDEWNPPAKTKVPSYDNEGNGIQYSTIDPEASIEGELIEGGSAMPGDFCNNQYFPEEYQGKLFTIDYHGWINILGFDENYKINEVRRFTRLNDKGITDLQFNPVTGQLCYVDFAAGKLRTVNYGGIRPPLAVIRADKSFGASPLTVNFDGVGSKIYDGSNASYFWDFGDGMTSEDVSPDHLFQANDGEIKTFQISLMVTDSTGSTDESTFTISLNNTPPVVDITSLSDGDHYSVSATNIYPLKANVTDLEQNGDDLEYRWQVILHHDEHIHPGPVNEQLESLAFIEPAGCGQETFFYSIILEVEDIAGLIGRDSISIFPFCGNDFSDILNLEANYSDNGILLTWDDQIEDEVDYYIIEHTEDFNFVEIGRVYSEAIGQYKYLHENAMNGKHFYRVRAVNKNGVPDYSNVANINYVESFSYTVAPNPVQGYLLVKVQHQNIQNVQFDLFTIAGQKVKSYKKSPSDSELIQTLEFDIEVTDLPSAAYMFRLKVNEENTSGRILKL